MGMSVVVIRNNAIDFVGSYGRRDFARNLQVEDSTVYRIASISKNITAVAAMKLFEQGLLQLDRDINFYLGYSVRNPSFPSDSITVRMLLSHTSSLTDGSQYDNFLSATSSQNPPPSAQTYIGAGGTYYTADLYLNRKPGTYFSYSNTNYGVLGTIIEKASGTRFDVFVRQNIFLPLGIVGSFRVNDLPNINNVAVLYRYQSGAWTPQLDNYLGVMPAPRDLSAYTIGSNGWVFGPQGNLRISPVELARYQIMLQNNGILNGTRILNESTVRLMRNPAHVYNGSNGSTSFGLFRSWGLGTHITTNTANNDIVFPSGRPMWGHPGEAYGLVSDMYSDTLAKTGVIFITNGKQGSYTVPANSAFYTVEKKVFDAAYTYLASVTPVQDLPYNPHGIRFFPNPATGFIRLQARQAGKRTVLLTDLNGRMMSRTDWNTEQTTLGLPALAGGVYFIHVFEKGRKVLAEKLVKLAQ